jgi:hypothetical protein
MTVEPAVDGSLPRQLLKQAEAIAELRQQLERLIEETTATLTDFAVRLETVEDPAMAGLGSDVTSWCWRNVGPAGAEALWSELRDWVGWIRHRYPLARRIPECCAEHPEVVEEFTALWLAWQAAYVERDASLTAAAEWHDRWLPGVLHRLEHGPIAIDCDTTHRPRPLSAYKKCGHSRSSSGEQTP